MFRKWTSDDYRDDALAHKTERRTFDPDTAELPLEQSLSGLKRMHLLVFQGLYENAWIKLLDHLDHALLGL